MSQKNINFYILLILLWVPLSGILNNLTNDATAILLEKGYRLLILVISILIISKIKFTNIIKNRLFLIFVLSLYICFVYYETSYNIPLEVKGAQNLIYNTYIYKNIIYYFLFYLTITAWFFTKPQAFNSIIKPYIIVSTCCYVVLMAVILLKHGLVFLLTEALMFNGISLILFSYEIIFTILVIIYAWHIKLISRNLMLTMGSINLALILSMGKRGPLLSILVVLSCIWIFKRMSIKRSLCILSIGIICYNLFIFYIDNIIDILKSINLRLGTTFADFYYYGDLNGRETLHEYAYEQIGMHPLWGKFPGLITPTPFEWCFGFHPHNIWLEAIITMGYIGSIPFYILIIYMLLKRAIPGLNSNSYYMFFSILFISEIVHGFLSGTLPDSKIWMAMCVLIYKPIKLPQYAR